jgi:hypothetical protein
VGELAPATPIVIDSIVTGDPEEPCGQITARLETLEGSRNVQKDLLCKLIRFFHATGKLISDIPNLPVIARN